MNSACAKIFAGGENLVRRKGAAGQKAGWTGLPLPICWAALSFKRLILRFLNNVMQPIIYSKILLSRVTFCTIYHKRF